jgi:hypothetical protein
MPALMIHRAALRVAVDYVAEYVRHLGARQAVGRPDSVLALANEQNHELA